MSNHGNQPFPFDDEDKPEFQKRQERVRELLTSAAEFRGALGDFPEGMLCKTDEGAIQFAVGDKDGKVVIDFGTPVHWLGMTPQQAADFASTIFKHARLVARRHGQSVAIKI